VRGESGQASVEYVFALVIVLVIAGAVGTLHKTYVQGGKRHGSAISKTIGRAPYSAPTAGEVNAQCLKDILMH
jgi:uncharacterized protein (UPF0333 family)